jgi:quercetin dioxygenase-like cupin family protein
VGWSARVRSRTKFREAADRGCLASANDEDLTAVKAIPSVQVDNERVIVTEWRFAPGADTGYHVHAHDYVVVPLTTGTLRLEESAGVRDVRLQVGASYARSAGVAHNVINVNDHEFRFVEIELK